MISMVAICAVVDEGPSGYARGRRAATLGKSRDGRAPLWQNEAGAVLAEAPNWDNSSNFNAPADRVITGPILAE
jgi:hypothetical protein